MLRTVRAGMLAVSSRVAARLPHLSKHDVAEIDQEIRIVLTELGTTRR
ncbi:phage terminase Nu1 subunit (DNA packaging protein) [Bradyrhizobium sp. LM2.7]